MTINCGIALLALMCMAMSMPRKDGDVQLERRLPEPSGSAVLSGPAPVSASTPAPGSAATSGSTVPSGSAIPSGSAPPPGFPPISGSGTAPSSGSLTLISSGSGVPPTTPTSQSSTPPTTTSSAPTVTWTVIVNVGTSSLPIGNADNSTFEGIMSQACGSAGCDAGSPQTFPFSYVDPNSGVIGDDTGTFVMSGTVDNNQAYTNDLVQAINGALQGSIQCSQEGGSSCPPSKRDPQWGDQGQSCTGETVTQCTMVNYISATMWTNEGAQGSTVTMSASSDVTNDWDCGAFWNTMNGILDPMDLPSPLEDVLAIAQLASCP